MTTGIRAIIVMGVSGSGKSTISEALARHLGFAHEDGDAYHPDANVRKMQDGVPLTDQDRAPWLRTLAGMIDRYADAGTPLVLACSALKRAYRDVLVHGRDDVRVVYLKGSRTLMASRLGRRSGHFMPESLLESQFATLEEPAEDEHAITVDAEASVEAIVNEVTDRLGLASAVLAQVTTPVRLVISDVDGTLLTRDKRLTPSSIAAVRSLRENGVRFTVTSSRPGFGLRMLVEPLAIDLPMGPFNGSAIVNPDLTIEEQHLIPRDAVTRCLEFFAEHGVDVWLFTNRQWLIQRDDGQYVPRECKAIMAAPELIGDATPYLGEICKVVGVSADFALLERCERELHLALGKAAHAARSQNYYLDVTPPNCDKGTFVAAMARRLGIPPDEIATLGDMPNDVPMFRQSGVSYAMGNASDEVKRHAARVTTSNEEDGFAKAIAQILALRE